MNMYGGVRDPTVSDPTVPPPSRCLQSASKSVNLVDSGTEGTPREDRDGRFLFIKLLRRHGGTVLLKSMRNSILRGKIWNNSSQNDLQMTTIGG